jgi:hypothetical protein
MRRFVMIATACYKGFYADGVAQISPGQSAAAKPHSAALGNGETTESLL